MVDEALAATKATQSRLRNLPARVVIYLLLAACLFPEVGYPGVWRKLTAGLTALCPVTPTAGALAQARRRVGLAPLRWLFDLLRGPAATLRAPGTRWRGLLVCAIDGTTMTVPDAPAILPIFCKQAGNHGGTGYPQVRLLALVACGTRTIHHRRGIRSDHQRGDHLHAAPAFQPAAGDDPVSRPQLRRSGPAHRHRRHRRPPAGPA
jgi:hypothetical protein